MKDSKKGFTIIEVVVVLAIAGLIFGVVFWALPNLQKSNRDSTRRTMVANVIANLDQYAANNNGAYPAAATGAGGFATFVTSYFSDGIEDPLGGAYSYNFTATDASTFTNYSTMIYRTTAKCTSTPGVIDVNASHGARALAVAVRLEQGGGYCVDNN